MRSKSDNTKKLEKPRSARKRRPTPAQKRAIARRKRKDRLSPEQLGYGMIVADPHAWYGEEAG